MRSITKLLPLIVLLLPPPMVCLAADAVIPISKEQAKKLGIEVRLEPAGPDHAWVGLDAEIKRLDDGFMGTVDFSSLPIGVDLEMRDGEKLLLSTTLLRDRSPKSGRVAVGFKVARSELNKLSLTVSADDGLGRYVYVTRVRDFVDPEGLRDTTQKRVTSGAEKRPSGPAN